MRKGLSHTALTPFGLAETPVGMDDRELFLRIAQGDKSAFGVFVNRHLEATVKFVARYLKNSADAEDVAQDSFIRVWQHAPEWKDQGHSPRSWLYRIAYNRAMDVLRRRKPEEDIDELPGESSTPEDVAIQRDQSNIVNKAIAALPERQRTALWLCSHYGLSNKEAAEILQVSTEALESLLARARRSLRASLKISEGRMS